MITLLHFNKSFQPKNILFTIFLCIVNSGCHPLRNLTPFYGFSNKPSVWKMTRFKIKNVNDSIVEIPNSYIVVHFDRKGRISKRQTFNPDGTPNSGISKYKYDKFGNELEIINYGIDDSFIQNRVSIRNKYGVLLKSYVIAKDGHKHLERNYAFDEKLRTSKAYTIKGDSMNIHNIAKYNRKWKSVEGLKLDSLGNIIVKTTYWHDNQGNTIKTVWQNFESGFTWVIHQEYNDRNEVLNTLKITKYENGQPDKIDSTRYDYLRDTYGNWIKRTLYDNGIPVYSAKSEFTYSW